MAAGAISATYTAPPVSQVHWDAIWLSDEAFQNTYHMTKQEYYEGQEKAQ